ncbi:MAG: hypothetical protein AAFO95_17355 [Cyanobacteria bacterium J06600_6]
MRHHLAKICFATLLSISLVVSGIFSFSTPAQASQVESQPYFIKQIEKNRILSVSPNFRGDLTQASLLPSLMEISQDYHIKATRAVKAEKLNGKQVPGLIVYVESKNAVGQSSGMVATKP